MLFFDLVFLAGAMTALIVLLVALAQLIRGRRAAAISKLRKLAIGIVTYAAIAIVSDLASPHWILEPGEPQCFDDWCITVTGAARGADNRVDVSLRLSSRARRTPQGEKGTVAYLVDSKERRFDPLPDPAAVPFSTLLQPGESVQATRQFRVASDSRDLGFVYTHQGGFPIGLFVIGEGSAYFHGPTMVRLDLP